MPSLIPNFTLPNLQDVIETFNDPAQLVPQLFPVGAVLILGAVAYHYMSPKDKSNTYQLGGIPVITAWTFFKKRHDFIWTHFKSIPEHLFKFKVLQHNVVVVRGDEARKTFFNAIGLDLPEGYKILMGGGPLIHEVNIKPHFKEGDISWLNKLLATLLNQTHFDDMLPSLTGDVERHAQLWGVEGRMDPFENIYNLVFQMTIRMATCKDLADNVDAVREVQQLYWTLETSSTPQALLLPWFPSRSRRSKDNATKALYAKLYSIAEVRRGASVLSSDAIDVLISEGYSTEAVVEFVMTVIFAGVINTGITACWVTIYIGMHPEWKDKVKAEVDSLLENYTANPSDPVYKRLAAIPASAWDDEMPMFDLVLRESMRLVRAGTALRRNLGEPLDIAGGRVEVGDFVVYSVADVHLNPDIYANPESFDPLRFGPGREEDKKGTFSFLGWGGGRHPCTGRKVAMLEIKVIVAYMLAGYNYSIVDRSGLPLKNLPVSNKNDIQRARPKGKSLFLQYERTTA